MNEREMIARTKQFALRMIAKLGTVEVEAAESTFWLKLIIEGDLLVQIQPLLKKRSILSP
jgi:hypothetical protein